MIKRSLSAHERWRVPLVLLCLASRTASYALQRDDDADGLLPDDVGLLASNASGRRAGRSILNWRSPARTRTRRGAGTVDSPDARASRATRAPLPAVTCCSRRAWMRAQQPAAAQRAGGGRPGALLPRRWYDKKVLLHSEFPAQAQMDQPFFNRSSSASAMARRASLSNSDRRYRCAGRARTMRTTWRSTRAGGHRLPRQPRHVWRHVVGRHRQRPRLGDRDQWRGAAAARPVADHLAAAAGIVFKLNTKRHWRWPCSRSRRSRREGQAGRARVARLDDGLTTSPTCATRT